MPLKEKVKEELKEAIGDFSIATLAAILVHYILKRGGEVVLEKTQKRYGEITDQRAEIAQDLLNLKPDEKANLIARLEKARQTPGEENRMVTLLCRLPKDEKGSRVELLKKFNALEDKEFDTVLYAIENDLITQLLLRALREGGAVMKVVAANLLAFGKETDTEVAVGLNAATAKIRELRGRMSK